MAKKIKLSVRKEPTQKRSIELCQAIREAATYILKHQGPEGFNTNIVAEKAGVNIASLYQYYPNKESLLFHLVEIEWEETSSKLAPLLKDKKYTPKERLRNFIHLFFESELEEVELRHSLRAATFSLEDTKEYKKLENKMDQMLNVFFQEALGKTSNFDFKMNFIMNIVWSFAEAITDEKISKNELRKNADTLCDMICDYFAIK